MNLSGCSKRGVGVFREPSHLKVGPPYLKVGPPSTKQSGHNRSAMYKIAAKQYSKNSNVYKLLARLLLLPDHAPSFAYVSSPTPATLHGAEVGGTARVWHNPLL